jgi:hypothetical protein
MDRKPKMASKKQSQPPKNTSRSKSLDFILIWRAGALANRPTNYKRPTAPKPPAAADCANS